MLKHFSHWPYLSAIEEEVGGHHEPTPLFLFLLTGDSVLQSMGEAINDAAALVITNVKGVQVRTWVAGRPGRY